MRSPGNNLKIEKRKSSRTEPWDTPMFRDQRDEKESAKEIRNISQWDKNKNRADGILDYKTFF